ncbi:unnamed protein product [Callosobruchus maculatus]|uniref:Uncharacterized protein n=1 Tax=Callosobruchus maculatus TaxID=64391 RepID=A0A653BPM3_CALMS|nr:unnamed protein product [Callosobruchus maculatus]
MRTVIMSSVIMSSVIVILPCLSVHFILHYSLTSIHTVKTLR